MAKPFNTLRGTELGIDDQLGFGRHIGYKVSEILKDRPEYIAWLIDNTGIRFTKQVNDLVDLYCPPKPVKFYVRSPKYMPDYDHDTLNEWSDWDADIPF